ncbi:DMT family transporter [Actinospica durhamensis]|uniref:DMT family transporter n=1 Tax=Actinospica durhamensis TaxID=1508375 RepID=A0A941IV84_9ACTN|nr:DMT family transporter [Actinospica durhamensis]MBR7836651.1 DMT family transporter [Actinospica durhamensis]
MLRIASTRNRRRLAFGHHDLALVAVTMVWGTTFLIIHIAMRHSGPLFFVGLRFTTAGLLTLLVFPTALRGATRHELAAGALIGLTLFLGYGLQTYGLRTIPSSASAFITALYVPMVPLFQWLLTRRPPKPAALLGIASAFIGLMLLAGPHGAAVHAGPGEFATLGAAVAAAAEIVLISRYAGNVDLRRITVVQLLVAGLLAFLAMPVTGEAVPSFSWIWLSAAVGLGVASALIQLTMNWAQKSVPATRATVIYAGEPVWGGVVGRLSGDRLPALALVGAGFIVLGVLISELRLPRRKAGAASGQTVVSPDEVPSTSLSL